MSGDREASGAAVPVVLGTLPEGARGRLVAVVGGLGLRSRLAAMGLRPGATVRVVHNGGGGPFVVAVGEARIVLGRGMARKVLVETVEEARPAGPGEGGRSAPDAAG